MTEEQKDEILEILEETKNLIEDECIVIARDNLVEIVRLLSL